LSRKHDDWMTRYDLLTALRAAGLALGISVVALVIMVASDEGGAGFPSRLGRLASLVPLAGGLGASIVAAQARARGEALALGALGVRPSRATRGAAGGGGLVGALGALLPLSRRVDLGSLFPRLPPTTSWGAAGPNVLRDAAHGIAVRSTGEILRLSEGGRWGQGMPTLEAVVLSGSGGLRAATAAALFIAAIAVPLWGVASSGRVRRIAVGVPLSFAAIAAFHLVAAERVSSTALTLAPALLLADAWLLHRVSR